ncbi:PilW family protein [Pseudidiomarina sediminum]|uniref:PilW family protein n=1 Tax=Pseudidiomarina sediminum TaxID=431675 RepID=UPI001C938F6A|nr:prepilin-type N-terminal cleavage/methylation domain-containing protein [Pseudidiomarina sediminum]MBY6064990.1 hypothetical protein [Pseudidiomarina sediminum]
MQRPQHGITLVSLLVGLMITSIVVVAMMTVYQTSVRAMVKSSESARVQSESLATLLTTHMSLQGAGFGVPPSELADEPRSVIDIGMGTLTNSGRLMPFGTGTALVWRIGSDTNNDFIPDSFQCEGLYVSPSSGIVQLVGQGSCSSARSNTWLGMRWTVIPLVSASRLVDPDGEVASLDNFFVRLEDRATPCSPFGASATTSDDGVLGRKAVIVGYERLIDGAFETISSTTCLVNLLPDGA